MSLTGTGRIYSDGEKFAIIQNNWGGETLQAIVGNSLMLSGLSVETGVGNICSLSLELRSFGYFEFLHGAAAEKAAAQLQSAWALPVEELLRIAYQKMDERSSQS